MEPVSISALLSGRPTHDGAIAALAVYKVAKTEYSTVDAAFSDRDMEHPPE